MGSVRARKETGLLFLDFRFKGQRCREQTMLKDTPANKKRLEKFLEGIELDISQGTFNYAETFPGSAKAMEFSTIADTVPPVPLKASIEKAVTATTAPSFRKFAEQWIEEHKIEWRRSHLRPLQSTVDNQLIAYFQDKPVGEIKREHTLAFRNHLASLPGRGGKGNLSNKRINGILGTLKQIMTEASERHGFPNPMSNYKPLRVRKSDVNPFSLAEVQHLLGIVRADFKDYLIVRFFTGMRTGEAHGLKWKYVDFANRLILIRETFVLGEDEYTKTDESQRDIQMSQPVYEALQRMHQATAGLSQYVFCNREGKPLDNKNFTDRVWYPLLRHAGLEQRRPYQMRHTAATLWLASGEAPEWIAGQLGHSDTQMLFKVYSRYVPNMTRQDGSAIDRLLASRFASGDIHAPPSASDADRSSPTRTASQGIKSAGPPPESHGPPPFMLGNKTRLASPLSHQNPAF